MLTPAAQSIAFELEDVDLEVVGHEVLDAAAELAAVGLVHRRRQHRAEASVAERLDRAGEVGLDLEAARQQLRLDHLGERLACARRPRVRRRHDELHLASRSTSSCVDSVASRSASTPTIADRQPDGAERELDRRDLGHGRPPRRSSWRIWASSAPGTSWASTVMSSSEQPARRIADRVQLASQALLAGR